MLPTPFEWCEHLSARSQNQDRFRFIMFNFFNCAGGLSDVRFVRNSADISDGVLFGFVWERTIEGHTHWSSVRDFLQENQTN